MNRTSSAPTPVYGYTRQSLTREGSESIEIQKAECERAAGRLGLVIVRWFHEAPSTSGYKNRGRSRAAFAELLEALPTGEARGILVYKSERLSRGGGPGWAPVFDAIDAAGINPDRAVATPNGWMSEFEIGIRATMDREESKKLSDRLLDVRAREALQGKPNSGGIRPFGYEKDHCTVVPAEAELIREAVDRVLLGESLTAICKDWQKRGIQSTAGGAWGRTSLRQVLEGRRISGQRLHRGEVVAAGAWPAIINPTTHERLLAVLEHRRQEHLSRTPPARLRSYALGYFIRCGNCEGTMRGHTKDGNRRCYACQPSATGGTMHKRSCGRMCIKAEPVEDEVRREVMAAWLDPETRRRLLALAPAAIEDRDLGEELRALEERKERLNELYLDGAIKRADHRVKLVAVEDGLAEIHAQLVSVAEHPILATLPIDPEELAALWDSGDLEWQRLFVEATLETVIIAPGRHPKITDRLTFVWRT